MILTRVGLLLSEILGMLPKGEAATRAQTEVVAPYVRFLLSPDVDFFSTTNVLDSTLSRRRRDAVVAAAADRFEEHVPQRLLPWLSDSGEYALQGASALLQAEVRRAMEAAT